MNQTPSRLSLTNATCFLSYECAMFLNTQWNDMIVLTNPMFVSILFRDIEDSSPTNTGLRNRTSGSGAVSV